MKLHAAVGSELRTTRRHETVFDVSLIKETEKVATVKGKSRPFAISQPVAKARIHRGKRMDPRYLLNPKQFKKEASRNGKILPR